MANAWKWYIVILCSEDWYIIFENVVIVKARSAGEAEQKAKEGTHDHVFVESTFGPFTKEPKEA